MTTAKSEPLRTAISKLSSIYIKIPSIETIDNPRDFAKKYIKELQMQLVLNDIDWGEFKKGLLEGAENPPPDKPEVKIYLQRMSKNYLGKPIRKRRRPPRDKNSSKMRRSALVKKIMVERGVKLPEASAIIKREELQW